MVTNADHVVALVVCLGLLFRRAVQRRHFGLPTHNDGALVCEYIVGLVGRSFMVVLACLLGLPTSWREAPSWCSAASVRWDSMVVVCEMMRLEPGSSV